MIIRSEEEIRKKAVHDVAEKMMIAARTAPKARGIDNLVIALVDEGPIAEISRKMKELVLQKGWPQTFNRDADNILNASCMVSYRHEN